MPSVNIPYVGVVEFPDTMSHEDISNVIKTQIMPNAPHPVGGDKPPSTGLADSINNIIHPAQAPQLPFAQGLAKNFIEHGFAAPFTHLGEMMMKDQVEGAPKKTPESPIVGSIAQGLKSFGDLYPQYLVSEALPIQDSRREKYGFNYEKATPQQRKEFAIDDAAINKHLGELQQSAVDIQAIQQKYGKDPLAKKIDALEQKPEYQNASGWQQAGMVGKEYVKNIGDFPEYAMNVGLSSLPQSIGMAIMSKIPGFAGMTGIKSQMIAGGYASASMEYGQEYTDLRQQGFTHEEANNKAAVKSGIIGALDAASLHSAGKLAEELFDSTAKHAWKETAKDIAKEIPKQAALGAAGEGLGSYASNQPVNPRAVFEEAVGEVAGAPGEVASTYQGKKAEMNQARQAKQRKAAEEAAAAAAPAQSPVPPNVQAGLVSESDLENPAAAPVPPVAKPAAEVNEHATAENPHAIDPELHTRATYQLEALMEGEKETGKYNVREVNKLARDLDLEPKKDAYETVAYIATHLVATHPYNKNTSYAEPAAEVPKEESATKVAPIAEEVVPPIDNGNNTEYRITKNDNGWAVSLVDLDANKAVTTKTFPTETFGEEGKQKAIDYAKSEAEKAKPYSEQTEATVDQTPKEEVAPEVKAEENTVEEQDPEVEEKPTAAEANQARQAQQQEKAQLKAPEDPDEMVKRQQGYEDAKEKYADEVDPETAFRLWKSAGQGVEIRDEFVPVANQLVETGLLAPAKGKKNVFLKGRGSLEAGINDSFANFEDIKNYLQPKKKTTVSKNTVFTDDAAEKARELLKKKLGQLNSGIDPEVLQAGITLSGYHVEKGARTFAAYSAAMIKDLGEIVRPYLKSWYMALKFDPRSEAFAKEMDSADSVEKAAAPASEEKLDLNTTDGKVKIATAVSQHFMAGNGFKDINEARKFIADLTGQKIEAGTMSAKQADEAIEVGVVLAARDIAQNSKTVNEAYDRLVDLYNRQPNLAVRSSTSVREQAYSTPAPLAFVASKLAGIDDTTTVYEPTAGNGMLLIDANPKKVIANELNLSRFEMLQEILPGARVINKNAMDVASGPFDVLVANPPFGSTGQEFRIDAYGFNTKEIDHAIALESLMQMKDNGKAVLILGGVRASSEEGRRDGYRAAAKRNFYFNLYKNFNVVDHFSVNGDMYSKQGASYPVDVIVIDGKGKSKRELPAADLPQEINSYEELKEKLNERAMVSRETGSTARANGSEREAGQPKPESVGERPSRPSGEHGVEGERSTEGSKRSVSENGVGERGQPESTGAGTGTGQPGPTNESERGSNRGPVSSEGRGEQPSGRESTKRNEPSTVGGPSVVSGARIESGLEDRRGQEAETGHQVAYEPHSQAASVGTLVPKAMAESINNSIAEVENQVGNVDQYVAEALNMDPETLKEKFSAEQIDALVLAIRNAEAGKGFIIGDQTGIGKGRVVAAMIKYAIENDKVPIFVTEKPNLYSDMIRDLDDIGMTKELGLDTAKPRIFITNSSEAIPYTLLRKVGEEVTENNLTLKAPKTGKALDDIMKGMQDKESLGDYKVIFTTYSQLQSVKGKETERQRFIKTFGNSNYMIFDESHNAGGAGETQARSKEQRDAAKEGKGLSTGRAAFVRELVDNAFGTFFSSATYAKRPDVMDLYSSTDMKLAVDNISELADAIKNGGIPMQQIVANMLTKVGQYIRRERTFAGVTYQTQETKVDKDTAENMATSMRDILAFSRAKELAVKDIQKQLDKSGGMARIEGEKTQVQSANFGAIMHNLIDQMLLSLKAQDSIKHAIESLKKGEKVVMTVSNTMGSFLQSYADEMGINVGDPVNLSFKDLYLRYLEKQRKIKIKGPQGVQEYRLTDEDLGPMMTAQYEKIKEFIENAGFGSAPISPIDYMHNELRKAGYKTEEITGRTSTLNYESGTPILTSRSANIKQRVGAVRAFNNGTADVIILNQAGSTGLSLHASDKFKDKRKRHMIIVQPEKNIDTHMQMLGRVHRTGQVIAPAYSQMMADIPAEMRPAAVLLKKMASLNANTTASRKSAVTAEGAVDFMNDYGGQIAQEFLRDNPEVHEAIGGKNVIGLVEDPTDAAEADIRKLTGYIPILPIKEQEEIYKDMIERYNDLIERENSMGSNKLEAKAVDLDAETVSSEPITPDRGDPSLFAQPAYMEKVDVKRTVKPFTNDEINKLIEENLNGETSNQKVTSLLDGVKERAAEYGKKQIENMTEKGADQVKLDNYKGLLQLQWNHIRSILNTYYIGQGISIKNNQGVFVYGVVTNIENKKKTANPVAGSDWKMTVALANGDARSITINFSQIGSTYQLSPEDVVQWYNPETEKAEHIPLRELFYKGTNVRREKRWMVTGNILAGFASDAVKNQGQIMSYTKADGTTGQGILMPRTYDFEKAQREAPIRLKNADDAIRFINEVDGVVTSADNVLRISRYGRQYRFNTSSSKKEGGTYFLDNGLLRLTGDFYKSGSTMYANVYDEERAHRAIDYILNERGDTLIASSPRDKAREMFAPAKPKPLQNRVVNKEVKEKIAKVHQQKTKEHAFDREYQEINFSLTPKELKEQLKKANREAKKVIAEEIKNLKNGVNDITSQKNITIGKEIVTETNKMLRAMAERKDKPEDVLARAQKALNAKEISQEVMDVLTYLYKQSPLLLDGLKLSIRNGKKGAGSVLGDFDALERIITLYKGTGTIDAGTVRHEFMHSLEQMMDAQTRIDLKKEWWSHVEDAMKKHTDVLSQRFFLAVNDYINDPTDEKFKAATDLMQDNDWYQYLNPSEYWAVNGEKLLNDKMKIGTRWDRYRAAIKQVLRAIMHNLGFNTQYTLYKTFNDLIEGKTPRTHKQMLLNMIETGPNQSRFLKNVQDTDNLLARHNRNQAPIHQSNTVTDKLLGGVQEMKNIGVRMATSPRLAVNNMIGGVDRAVLSARVQTTDFTAGLTAADRERYGHLLEDSQGRAIASVAMNQALKATRIGTQVVMLGKLVFDHTNQMFHAVQDRFSMANIISLKHQLEKQIGVQRAANVIQAYFEAKRSRSIVEEYLKREGDLEDLKTEQMDPMTPPDRQLQLLIEIEEAQEDFKNIGIALQKVNMTDEAIDDFIALEREYPELKEMMQNWNSVNKNMIDMMEVSRMISRQRADTLRSIKDYVPWQRIMDDQTDVHAPIYSTKGVKNVSREQRFKEGKVDLDIDDIVDNMLHNVMVTTRNAIKNYAANRIAQEYGTRNDNGKLKVFPKEDYARGIVKILVNGRKVNIQIADPLIAQSVIGIENIQIPMGDMLAFFSNTLRRSITFSGVFQIKQLFMDAPTAALVTGVKNPVALYGGVFRSFIKGLTQKDPVIELLKSYGIGGYHSGARTAEHQYRQEIGLLNKSAIAKAANILDKIADASDFAQRRAVYVRVMKETGGYPVGGDQRKAILAATNVIDFDKRGAGRSAQFLNRTIAFMNAYAQQLDVLTQTLAEPVAGGVEALTGVKITSVSGGLKGLNRQQAITRLTITAGLLAGTCLLYAMALGDDDEYKKMDDQTKMRNFVIPRSLMKEIGYDHTLLIPMHTSASYFFKAIPELLYEKITKEGTKDAIDNARLRKALKEGAIDALLGPLGSGPIPSAIKPFAEITLNHDFYTGGKVIPDSMKDLAPFKRYNGSTAELAKWLSAATQIPGTGKKDSKGNVVEGTEARLLSPISADHIARGLFGSVYAAAAWGSNLFTGEKPTSEERNNPLYGSFIAPEIPRGREDLFYDLKTRADEAMHTFKDTMKKGHREEAEKWFEVNQGLIRASGFTDAAGKSLIDINAQIRRLEDLPSTKMSPDEKRQQINFYKNKKEDILEQTIQFRLAAGL